MPPPEPGVETLLAEAVGLPDPGDRAAFLGRACGDPAVRAEVARLADLHFRAGSFLGRPAGDADPTATYSPPAPPPGGRVGPYKLLEVIGEGGMGVVWMAEQTEPVRRRVAVKLVRPGLDSAHQVLARFEQERQALALMDHPNIARVLDAGTAADGRPYFVMELVHGPPITTYCDDRRLGVADRLKLFVDVCRAVQHAHQKGVIHRDLKPGNVLVARYDEKSVPKVIDFGVAKAAGRPLTDKTLFTGFGGVVGTPEYMSPEQAAPNQLDVDTRSDVYALGVLLYELLTGTTPLTRARTRQAAVHEVLRLVREEEPPTPSSRLSSADGRAAVAACRGTEPRRLAGQVRGELDWVALRALEKDRDRRYDTAAALARDVERYLAGEVVEARRASAGYRLRKFVRRHRGPAVAASLVLLALLAGMGGTTWGLIEAREQKRQAIAARDAEAERADGERRAKLGAEAEQAKAVAAAAREAAARVTEERERKYAQAIADFVKNDFLALTSVEGQGRYSDAAADQLGKDATLRQLLDRAAAKLDGRTDLAPRTAAELRLIIGLSYRGVGEAATAIPHLERCVALFRASAGPTAADTLNAMNSLAMAYQVAGRLGQALPLHEETVRLQRATQGADHPHTLTSMGNLALAYQAAGRLDQALPLYEETLKLRQATQGADHPHTVSSMISLARGYLGAGKVGLALPLLEEAVRLRKAELGAEHIDTLTSQDCLGVAYQDAGRLDQARLLCEDTLRLKKGRLGADHPHTLVSMNNLAACYAAAGRLDLALPLYEDTLRGQTAKLGTDHPDTLKTMGNLGLAYKDARKPDLAVPLLEEALRLCRAGQGADHPETLRIMANLAASYQAAGKLDQARPLLEEALRLVRVKLGAEHPHTLTSMSSLASLYRAEGKPDQALPLLEEALRLRRAVLGADHPDTHQSMNNLAGIYREVGRLALGLPLLEAAAADIEEQHFRHKYADPIIPNLIDWYGRLGQLDRAESWRRKWMAVVKDRSGADSVPYGTELSWLGSNLLRQRRWADAEPVLRECLAVRETKLPGDWRTFNAQSQLGGALLGQGRHAEAGPLVLAGYEGLNARGQAIPPNGKARLGEAIDRLIELSAATGRPAEVTKWRAERAKYPELAPPPRPAGGP